MAGLGKGFTTPSTPVSFKGLGGGVNTTAGQLYLQPNEWSDLLNIDFDKFGSIIKRNGYTALNTSAFSVSKNFELQIEVGYKVYSNKATTVIS
jgi:hypothetical protein